MNSIQLPHWPIHTGYSSKDSISLMQTILEFMGNPHHKLKNIIHVGGTNGKGSTIAFISQIIRESGKTTNVYTSPHIFEYNERFNANGMNIKNEEIFFALEEVRSICEKHKLYPTILEASTIACFYLFNKFPADYNIIECCMGGLFDCTNVFQESNIACTVITSISKDHTKYLGETIAEISFHKAGIQKTGIPSVIAKQKEHDANTLLFNYAEKFQIPAYFFGADYSIATTEIEYKDKKQDEEAKKIISANTQIIYEDQKHTLFLPMPSLLGMHQLENLATALKVCSILNIETTNIPNAIIKTKWIGRLQRVYNIHFPKNLELWFDGAHNAGGAEVLVQWITETQTEKTDYIIIGKSKNADQYGFISKFKNLNAKLFFVTVEGEIFPETSTNLQKFAERIGVNGSDGKTFKNVIQNIKKNEEARIICCGSLYLLKDMEKFGSGS